jgi:aerobic-type carbon monoxide dehydrogenase small subunit (CoxS/CutS family)
MIAKAEFTGTIGRILPLLGNGEEIGSSSLLVMQVHGSKIATSEESVANWKVLVNQWKKEHSFRH